MATLLHLDASPMGDVSISRHLTAEFTNSWKLAHPDGTVIVRDVTTSAIPPVNAAWVGAARTPADSLTAEQKATLALSDTLIAELEAADEYVLGTPMHNFGIPSNLKLWIDNVARVNRTFSYATGAPVGLLKGKKATILIASGGSYDAGTATESYNFVEPYLRTILGFLGVTDVSVHSAGGAMALNYGADRQAFLEPHVTSIRASFHTA